MSKKTIEKLLKFNNHMPGEIHSRNSDILRKHNYRLKGYKELADYFCSRENLNLTGTQKEEVYNILELFNLKEIHRQYSDDLIILGICFYVKKVNGSFRRFPEDFRICNDYNLTTRVAFQITTRLLQLYREKIPLKFYSNT